MRWSYKTVHFSLKKDGLLGSAFLDESEIEASLNDYGKAGWELVSLTEVSDGLIGVFKQPFSQGISGMEEFGQCGESPEVETEPVQSIDPVIKSSAFLFSEKEEEIENMKDDEENRESDGADVGSIRIA